MRRAPSCSGMSRAPPTAGRLLLPDLLSGPCAEVIFEDSLSDSRFQMNRNHSDREWNCYDFFLAVIHVIEYTHANDKIRTRIRTCICTHQYKTGTHPATQRWAKYLLFITTQSSLLQKDQTKKKTWVFRSFAVTVWSRICSSKTSCKDARCTEACVAQG